MSVLFFLSKKNVSFVFREIKSQPIRSHFVSQLSFTTDEMFGCLLG